MRALVATSRSLGRCLLGLGLWRGRCRRCAADLSAMERAATSTMGVCSCCAVSLAPRRGGYCPRCGLLAEDETAPPVLCNACRHGMGPSWEALAFHGPYEAALKHLICELKYGRRLADAALLGRLMGEAARRATMTPDMAAPLPLHGRRLRARGFNQSLELARHVAKVLGVPCAGDALQRTRSTSPQAGKDRAAREMNVRGAFMGSPAVVAGRVVLLVDDVLTTGATAGEAARALRAAGAAGVLLVVAARA